MSLVTQLSNLSNRLWLISKSITTLSERRIVSKPQLLSRLRFVNIIKRCDETDQERLYRTQYEGIQEWNDRYWAENNELFNREKDHYIKQHFGDTFSSSEEALSHDQLAHFYRKFLEKNRQKHIVYNQTMYKNHLKLLVSSLNAKLSRLRANVKTDR